MNKKQLKHYKSFFDDNENGGSSRWLVSPDTVEMFIDTMLEEQRKEIVKEMTVKDVEELVGKKVKIVK